MKSDAKIQEDVLQELQWDNRVEATEVGVTVDVGVVTLTGTVRTFAERHAAQEAAHRVQGVLDVVNDITVSIPGVGARTDTEVAHAVRRALEWDALVPHEHIKTTVANGWVTLTGEVNRWPEREDAERAVLRLAGVRGVTNQITISGVNADPTEVRQAIEEALERRAAREAKRVTVTVSEGTVTLSGTVPTWQEKRAVVGAASHAPGVRKVDDRLYIDLTS